MTRQPHAYPVARPRSPLCDSPNCCLCRPRPAPDEPPADTAAELLLGLAMMALVFVALCVLWPVIR
jgi:hypothetical protein